VLHFHLNYGVGATHGVGVQVCAVVGTHCKILHIRHRSSEVKGINIISIHLVSFAEYLGVRAEREGVRLSGITLSLGSSKFESQK
jgi:hypothetical protein